MQTGLQYFLSCNTRWGCRKTSVKSNSFAGAWNIIAVQQCATRIQMGKMMNNCRTWRALACAVFAGTLFAQPLIVMAQEGPLTTIPPAEKACCRQMAVAQNPLTPLNDAQAYRAKAAATFQMLTEQKELAHVRESLSAGPLRITSGSASVTAGIHSGTVARLDFTPAFTAYLPMVVRRPGELTGNVTFSNAPVAGISVTLRYYDGVSYSSIATTTTNADGVYDFVEYPALTNTSQAYWIRYNNMERNDTRLGIWVTEVISTYALGERHQFAPFDIANIDPGTPGPTDVIVTPKTFTWTQRLGRPSDNYEMRIFDPTGVTTSSYTSGILGYVTSKSIVSLPSGMSLLALYGWDIVVHGANGSYGGSYYYNEFRFGKSGIQGHVTLNGSNISGVTVELFLKPASGTAISKGTTSTGSDGIYQFTGAATLTSGQKYYVRYRNTSTSYNSRIAAWYTDYITAYKTGARAYAGNFDIADALLVSPSGALYAPYSFSWVARNKSPYDYYFVEVYDAAYTIYAFTNSTLHASSLNFNTVPSGFSTGVSYYWDVGIYGNDGGIGYSYYYGPVTFW